jgi:hypothetical protein
MKKLVLLLVGMMFYIGGTAQRITKFNDLVEKVTVSSYSTSVVLKAHQIRVGIGGRLLANEKWSYQQFNTKVRPAFFVELNAPLFKQNWYEFQVGLEYDIVYGISNKYYANAINIIHITDYIGIYDKFGYDMFIPKTTKALLTNDFGLFFKF